MNKLILKSLGIKNFQCFKSFSIEFGKTQTDICGENGSGKTCIYSALTWLLLGKDAYGNSVFDIKHLVDGKKQDRVDVEVEGHFSYETEAGTEEMKLRRVLREKWTTPRGTKEQTYTSDETLCWWNEVPVTVTEYQNRVSKIIVEEDFKMLTNLKYFLSLKPAVQREYLCKIAGVRDVKDICEGNEGWKEFVSSINHKDLQEFLKIIRERRTNLKAELERIDPAIDALENSKPETMDWDKLEKEKADVNAEIESIDNAIASEAGRMDEASKGKTLLIQRRSLIEDELNKVRVKKNALYREAEKKQEQEVWNCQEEWRELERQIKSKTNELNAIPKPGAINAKIKRLTSESDELVNKYYEYNQKTFEQGENAPICPLLDGHLCTSNPVIEKFLQDKDKAREKFNQENQKRIALILEEGRSKLEEIETAKKELQENDSIVIRLNEEIDSLKRSLSERTPKVNKAQTLSPIGIPGWDELRIKENNLAKQINALNEEINKYKIDVVEDGSLATRKRELNFQLEKAIRQLALKDQIKKIDAQINSKEGQAKSLASQIAGIDGQEFTATEINRAVIDDCTGRINKLFAITKWKMFELQKNGFYADVCKPTIDGVSVSLNTASWVNIGLDICNVISRYRGLSVPTFIDYRESVNEIIPTESQVINLFVAPKGSELKIINKI